MKKLGRRGVICSALIGTALAGCRSAPPAQYFRLAPVAGTPVQTAPGAVLVRNIGIPGYLQSSGIPEPSGQYEFASAANDLWAEPLSEMLQSVLVQDLTQLLPRMTVTASSGSIGAPANLMVEVNVLRFDPDASGQITLSAQIALKATADNRFLASQNVVENAAPGGPGTAGQMAAMSGLWSGLATRVAQMIARNSAAAD